MDAWPAHRFSAGLRRRRRSRLPAMAEPCASLWGGLRGRAWLAPHRASRPEREAAPLPSSAEAVARGRVRARGTHGLTAGGVRLRDFFFTRRFPVDFSQEEEDEVALPWTLKVLGLAEGKAGSLIPYRHSES